MRRMMAAALVLGAMTVPAAADHSTSDFVASGTILVGDPATRVIGGVAEQVSPCNGSIDPEVPNGLANGTDGVWIQLPDNAGAHAATLTSTAPNDVDAWFYTDTCALVTPSMDPDAYSMASLDAQPDGDEAGTIPVLASWVVIDLYVGAAAPFTFTITGAGTA